MTIPRQRSERPVPPRKVVVGDRREGGQLSASVRRHGQRGRRIFVNVVEISGLTIDVSVEDARTFAIGLLAITDPGTVV